jgi:hypothetical protein
MEIHLKKNEAAYITFPMLTTANPETFDTGETVTDTAYYKDGAGAWTSLAITDTVTEIATTGMYSIDLTAAEMNHDLIAIKFTSTNAADTMAMIRTYSVDVDDLVRATTPANTLDVDASGDVTVGTNNDKTGYTASSVTDKTGYSISGTKTTLDALNDVAATDIVSAGAITTSGGAVSNVTTVATTTTNTDMRGTDSALLASSAPTNFGDLAITATTGLVTVGTNNDKTGYTASTVSDKTGYSISGTITTLDGLENVSTAQVNAEVVDALVTDTYAEPGQGAPGATVSLKDKIGYIYKFLRNKKTATSTTISVYDDAGTTVDQKATISDDATTYTEEEYVSGP